MMDFNRRVAIVTGAGAGLGRSHALGLAAAGARVVVNDLGAEAAEAVAAEIAAAGGEALACAGSVTEAAAMAAMAEAALARWGRIDVLVNNAGILRDRTFAKMTAQEFDLVIATHLTGTFHATKAVWEAMRAQGYGRIVLTSSASGIYGNFGQANYGAAKAAMIGLMNVLNLEGARHGIRVNTLAPTAATGMTEGLIDAEEAALLAPATVTPGVLFLASAGAPAGMILGAGAGVFAATHIAETEGVYLPPEARTPEGIAAALAAITDRSREERLEHALAQTRKFVRIARENR